MPWPKNLPPPSQYRIVVVDLSSIDCDAVFDDRDHVAYVDQEVIKRSLAVLLGHLRGRDPGLTPDPPASAAS